MPSHTSRRSSSQDNKPFDLTDIFIGREQQLDLFEAYLNRWKQLMLHARTDDSLPMPAPSPNDKIQGLVVLIYGRGGIGKSSLLKRYRDIALRESQIPRMSRTLISTIVDWEFSVEGKRGTFNPLQGQDIDAIAYFQLLCSQLAIALHNKPLKEFRKYHEAVKAVEKARKEASEVLDQQVKRLLELHAVEHAQKEASEGPGNMQRDERYAKLRNMSVDVLFTLLSTVVPPPVGPFLGTEIIKEAASEGMEITAELLMQVKEKLQERLGSRLDDLRDPASRLGIALGRDLYEFARDFPLLIFFDTYEEIDEGDQLLRIVMGAAGPRLGWVIAGRDNLWAGVGQRERSMDIEYGYKDIVPSDRGLPVNLDASDAGAFTLSTIHHYFTLLRQKVQPELFLPGVTEEGANRIWEVTLGVPLAVKIAAGLYLETASLDTITEDVQGKREIVDKMVRRYLLHTRADQAEQAKLYGLALLRRADQPAAIAAALGLSTQAGYRSELRRLNRRYSFIFTEKAQPSLHEDVRHFLRLWLLEHRREPEIMAVNERLKEAHVTSLQKLEEKRNYSSLKERLQNDEWVGVYLDLTEQQFWLDPVEGVRYILPFLIAASRYRATSYTFSMYRHDIDEDVVELGQFFEATIEFPYRDWWQMTVRSLIGRSNPFASNPWTPTVRGISEWEPGVRSLNYRPNPFASNPWGAPTVQGMPSWNDLTSPFGVPQESTSSQLEALAKLVDQQHLTFAQPLPNYKAELEALLWWHLGEVWQYQDNEKARGWYEKALTQLREEPELRKAIASLCRNIGINFYNEKKYAESIPPLNRAIELDPNNVFSYAYEYRGLAYADLGQFERAIADHNRTIELNPNFAKAYYNRGRAYADLGQFERAIADHNCTLELDPNFAQAHNDRGRAYADLGQFERAIADYSRTLELDPNFAQAHNDRGVAYFLLGQTERAIADYNRTLELDPNYAIAHNNRGFAYSSLGQFERAIADYNRTLELDPNYAIAHNNRGRAYSSLGQTERALQDYNRAIELDPNNAKAYTNRGISYLSLKNIEQAKADFDRAVELDPTYIRAAWVSCWARMSKQRNDRALLEQLEKMAAIDLKPDDLNHYLKDVCQAVILSLRGNPKQGLAILGRATSLQGEPWNIYFWKGMLCAYYYQGRYQLAREAIEKALDLKMPPLLLTPLYWLEEDRPDFFQQYAKPLLEEYGV